MKQSNLTEVGRQRKRKQAKVVGEEENKAEPEETPKATEKPRKSKKGKKIKLSFDEEWIWKYPMMQIIYPTI